MALCSELGWLLDETYLWSRTFSAATAIFCGYAISQPYAADSRLGAFSHVRFLLNSLVAPIQYAADLPRVLFDDFYDSISSHQQLRENNQLLKREVLTLKSNLLLLEQYKEENQRLRKLLGSSFLRDEKRW